MMMGDELLSKHSPDKNQRLVMINDKGIYYVKYRDLGDKSAQNKP